jgi:hypothetical protein
MSHYYHKAKYDDDDDGLLGVFAIPTAMAVIALVVTVLVSLCAGCYTLVWHVGHWVNWW